MDFEFDEAKSIANKRKHGIDFHEVQDLWNDSKHVEIPAKISGEHRFILIGIISEKYWSAVITYRADNIRLISVRRSRKEEIRIYENFGI